MNEKGRSPLADLFSVEERDGIGGGRRWQEPRLRNLETPSPCRGGGREKDFEITLKDI